jgi:hypothetical protein
MTVLHLGATEFPRHVGSDGEFDMQNANAMRDEALGQLSELLKVSNYVTGRMSSLIGRPANTGSIGEFIASAIFNIDLSSSAVTKTIDGHFRDGSVVGQTVNVKFYARWGALLDLAASRDVDSHAQWYLVLAGPPAPYVSKGTVAPLVIERVFLFNADLLLQKLIPGWKPHQIPGIATSVKKALWAEAEIYPNQVNTALTVTDEQRAALQLFAPG